MHAFLIDKFSVVSPSLAVGAGRRVDTRACVGYSYGNYSPPSEPSGPNWRGLSIPARLSSIEAASHG